MIFFVYIHSNIDIHYFLLGLYLAQVDKHYVCSLGSRLFVKPNIAEHHSISISYNGARHPFTTLVPVSVCVYFLLFSSGAVHERRVQGITDMSLLVEQKLIELPFAASYY